MELLHPEEELPETIEVLAEGGEDIILDLLNRRDFLGNHHKDRSIP